MTTTAPNPIATDPMVESAFEAHERAIRVPDVQNAEAKALHPPLRKDLTDRLGLPETASFLAGSYRRKTQIAPLQDLDIIIVMGSAGPDGPDQSPVDVLGRVARAAESCDLVRRIDKIGVRAVTCVLWNSEIMLDFVPAFEAGVEERLWLCRNKPEDGLVDWSLAHPRGQILATSTANIACGGTYIPLVRVAKGWNCAAGPGDEKLLPSYALEAATHGALGLEPTAFAPGLAATLATLEDHLVNHRPLPDPGSPESDVFEMLDEDRRQRAIPIVRAASRQAEQACNSARELALAIWGDLLGPTFPGPAQRPGRIGAGLVAGTVGVAGSGISVSAAARSLPKTTRAWRPFPR